MSERDDRDEVVEDLELQNTEADDVVGGDAKTPPPPAPKNFLHYQFSTVFTTKID